MRSSIFCGMSLELGCKYIAICQLIFGGLAYAFIAAFNPQIMIYIGHFVYDYHRGPMGDYIIQYIGLILAAFMPPQPLNIIQSLGVILAGGLLLWGTL